MAGIWHFHQDYEERKDKSVQGDPREDETLYFGRGGGEDGLCGGEATIGAAGDFGVANARAEGGGGECQAECE